MKFQVGDRVVCTKDGGGEPGYKFPRCGQVGTIFEKDNSEIYLVSFDDYFPTGHDGDGSIEWGHGWWCFPEYLEHVVESDDLDSEIDLGDML